MMMLYYTLRTVHDVPYHLSFLFKDLTALYVYGVQLRAPTQTERSQHKRPREILYK